MKPIMEEAAEFYSWCLSGSNAFEARRYIDARGLSDNAVRKFQIGFSPQKGNRLTEHLSRNYQGEEIIRAGLAVEKEGRLVDRFRGRLMFPVRDINGLAVAFGARLICGSGAKYINSPNTAYDKGGTLFGLDAAVKSPHNYFVLVEGYMDVIAMHMAGFANAVASCGTALTEKQARLLSSRNVVILYDGDEAGKRAVVRAISKLRKAGVDPRVASLRDAKDPDEYLQNHSRDELGETLMEAVSARKFVVGTALERYKSRGDIAALSDALICEFNGDEEALIEAVRRL